MKSVALGFRKLANGVLFPLLALLALGGVAATPAHGAAGDIDTTFGGGAVLTDFGGFGDGRIDRVNGVAVDAQGRIVAVGSSASSNLALGTVWALARYNSDGTLDGTFGSNGKVTSGFGFTIGANSEANAVAIDGDGRIVVAGWTDAIGNVCTDPPCSVNERFLIARYNIDGSLDTTFAGSGVVTAAIGDLARASSIGIDSAGRIVVAGITLKDVGSFGVMRLRPDGFQDFSFGDRGLVVTPLGDEVFDTSSLAVDAQDRVVVAGDVLTADNVQFALVRYNTNGTLDASFDRDGIVFTDVSDKFCDCRPHIAIDRQGRIVAAGSSYDPAPAPTQLAIVRYNDDGSLDTRFGSGFGKVLSDAVPGARSLVIDGFGRIVVAGDVGLARFNADGAIDDSFGTLGQVTTSLPGGALASFNALAIDGVGRLIAGGVSMNIGSGSVDFTLVRYLSDDFSFSSVPTFVMAVNSSFAQSVTLNSLSKFDSTVSLALSGQPNDVTASVSPSSITPPAGGSASTALSIALGPSVTPGSFSVTLTGTSPAVDHSVSVSVDVYATSASIANAVGTMTTAGCIDKGIGGAMTSTLVAMQSDIDAGRLGAARSTRNALLYQIGAQSGKMIATSCTINSVTLDPVTVLTTDLQLVQGL